jgi:hypothetical protein
MTGHQCRRVAWRVGAIACPLNQIHAELGLVSKATVMLDLDMKIISSTAMFLKFASHRSPRDVAPIGGCLYKKLPNLFFLL